MDTRTPPARARLVRLREVLQQERVDAVLVPSSDPHLSEYLPGRWQGREHFSGFTGSMGTLVVTPTDAALFADSRYWTQAEAQLRDSGIDLVRIPTATVPPRCTCCASQSMWCVAAPVGIFTSAMPLPCSSASACVQ